MSPIGPAFIGCDGSSAICRGGPLPVVSGASLAPGSGAIPVIGVEDMSSVIGDPPSLVSG